MKAYKYSRGSVLWEIIVSFLLLTGILILVITGNPSRGTLVFFVIVIVFITFYIILGVNKLKTVIITDEDGLSFESFFKREVSIRWDNLGEIKTRFYGTGKRKSGSGIHSVKLKWETGSFKFDSGVESFFVLMAEIGNKVMKYNVKYDEITKWNLEETSIIPRKEEPKTEKDDAEKSSGDIPPGVPPRG